MDSFVTARVPDEIKEQGNVIPESIGSSPTELVDAAYEYALVEGGAPKSGARSKEKGRLDSSLLEERAESLRVATLVVPEAYWGGKSYKELIEEGRRAEYEALS